MTAPSEFHPLTLERHADRYWRRVSSYGFAAHQPLVPLAGLELSQAALALPVAFVKYGEVFSCVAVVGTRDGEWVLLRIENFNDFSFFELAEVFDHTHGQKAFTILNGFGSALVEHDFAGDEAPGGQPFLTGRL